VRRRLPDPPAAKWDRVHSITLMSSPIACCQWEGSLSASSRPRGPVLPDLSPDVTEDATHVPFLDQPLIALWLSRLRQDRSGDGSASPRSGA